MHNIWKKFITIGSYHVLALIESKLIYVDEVTINYSNDIYDIFCITPLFKGLFL
jgi:hypothetical protein